MKPYPEKTAEAHKMLEWISKLWKKHGAIEAVGYQLFGSAYGHFSMVVKIENMENYGKHNDAFVADPECQKALAEGENVGEVVRHTLARTITE